MYNMRCIDEKRTTTSVVFFRKNKQIIIIIKKITVAIRVLQRDHTTAHKTIMDELANRTAHGRLIRIKNA